MHLNLSMSDLRGQLNICAKSVDNSSFGPIGYEIAGFFFHHCTKVSKQKFNYDGRASLTDISELKNYAIPADWLLRNGNQKKKTRNEIVCISYA